MALNQPNPNGQALAISSSPVVIASDQSTVKTKLATDIPAVAGTITTTTGTVTLTDLTGIGSATITIAGTYAGLNATFEVWDGVRWYVIAGQQTGTNSPTSIITTGTLGSNSSNMWNVFPLLGVTQLRVRATALTSGSAEVRIMPSAQFAAWQGSVAVTGGSITAGGVSGLAAIDAAVTGNPVQMAGRASNAVPTAMSADNDIQLPWLDRVGRLNVVQKAMTGVGSSVAAATTSTTILAANTARIGATITNESSAVMSVALFSGASATSYTVQLAGQAAAPYSYYEVPAGYTGIITGLWATAAGNARVTEIS